MQSKIDVSKTFKEDSIKLLLGIKNLGSHQTLPGSDAIYIPCEGGNERDDYLALNEEIFHIDQLRSYTSGWYLELLKREFAHEVLNFKHNEIDIKSVKNKYLRLKKYSDSIRIPLEYHFRCRCLFELWYLGENEDFQEYMFNEIDPFKTNFFDKEDDRLDELKLPHNFKKKNHQAIFKEIRNDPKIPAEDYMQKSELILQWLEKVTKAYQYLDKKVEEKPNFLNSLIYTLYTLHSFPARVALRPSFDPEKIQNNRIEKNISVSPRKRFFHILTSLMDLSAESFGRKLEQCLNLPEKEFDFNRLEHFLISFLIERGIPKRVKYKLNNIEYFHGVAERLKSETTDLADLPPIIPLRKKDNSFLLQKSDLIEEFVLDGSDLSIEIKQICKDGNKKEYTIKLTKDPISDQLLKELELVIEGLNLLKKDSNIL